MDIQYRRLEGVHPLGGDVWHCGDPATLGTRLDVPDALLGGPVGAFVGGDLVAAIGRSEDFAPYAMMVRDDFASGEGGIRVAVRERLTIRSEINPVRLASPGRPAKPQTDMLLLEGPSGMLVRMG